MLKAAKMNKASMGWLSIITAILGGFAGYVFGVVSKPRFEYLGITGNPYGQYLQCAARFRMEDLSLIVTIRNTSQPTRTSTTCNSAGVATSQ
jgi:hypothetical protein